MANNNTVTLIGNMGSEAKIIEGTEKPFAAFSLATTDSYQDKDGNWQDKETIWHNILIFNSHLIEEVKTLKKGARLKITGSISYRPFEVYGDDGPLVTKKEASIIAIKVEQAPLVKRAA